MLKKIITILFIIILLLIAVGAVGILWGLNKVSSPEFKQIIEAKVAESTGVNVEIDQLKVGCLSAEITNLHVPASKGSADNEQFLQVKNIKVHYSIWKFLRQPIVVDKLEIDEPTIIARQDSEGNLQLPIEQHPKPSTETSSPAISGKPLLLELPKIEVRNANLTLYNAQKAVVFAAENANFHVAYHKQEQTQSANGSLAIKKITFTPGLSVTDFSSPFSYANDKINLANFKSGIYAGELSGNANVDLSVKPGTFGTQMTISKMDLGQLLSALGSDADTINGKLNLNFTGNGTLDAPKNLNGKGELLIPDPVIGKLKSYQNLTSILGTLGGVSSLKDGKFDSIKSSFSIAEQKIQLDPLEVLSQNINIHMTGPIGFDQSLDLHGKLSLAPGILQMAQTVESIINAVNAIKQSDASGQPATTDSSSSKIPDLTNLTLNITGFASNPKIEILNAKGEPLKLNSATPASPSSSNAITPDKVSELLNDFGGNFLRKKKAAAAPTPPDTPSQPASTPTPPPTEPTPAPAAPNGE